MQVMHEVDASAKPATYRDWPNCEFAGGTCLLYEMGRYLGRRNLQALLDFVSKAEDGGRLILQRNHSAFSVQVTSAVLRGNGEILGTSDVRVLRERLRQRPGGQIPE